MELNRSLNERIMFCGNSCCAKCFVESRNRGIISRVESDANAGRMIENIIMKNRP